MLRNILLGIEVDLLPKIQHIIRILYWLNDALINNNKINQFLIFINLHQ